MVAWSVFSCFLMFFGWFLVVVWLAFGDFSVVFGWFVDCFQGFPGVIGFRPFSWLAKGFYWFYIGFVVASQGFLNGFQCFLRFSRFNKK